MKTWLKGGLIGLAIAIPLIILTIPLVAFTPIGALFGCPMQASVWIIPGGYNCEGVQQLMVFAVHFAFYFLIGSLIGWLVERKNSSKMPPQ